MNNTYQATRNKKCKKKKNQGIDDDIQTCCSCLTKKTIQ